MEKSWKCDNSEWISDTELKCITAPGSGGDLIPRVAVAGQFNVVEEIFDEHAMEKKMEASIDATAEAKIREEEGDLTMSLM